MLIKDHDATILTDKSKTSLLTGGYKIPCYLSTVLKPLLLTDSYRILGTL